MIQSEYKALRIIYRIHDIIGNAVCKIESINLRSAYRKAVKDYLDYAAKDTNLGVGL